MTSALAVNTQTSAQRSRYASGLLFAVASAATFGLSGSLARAPLDAGWSPAAIVSTRVGGAFLVLLIPCLLLLRW